MSEIKHTPVFHGPFEYVPGTENHGPYVTNAVGNTVCDCYVMTQPAAWSVRTPVPVNHCGEMAEDYARLFGASFELLDELNQAVYAMDLMADILRRLVVDDQRCATFLAGLDAALSSARAAIAKAEGRS
jgi:hypothetical protein